jgi:hypothetical protein
MKEHTICRTFYTWDHSLLPNLCFILFSQSSFSRLLPPVLVVHPLPISFRVSSIKCTCHLNINITIIVIKSVSASRIMMNGRYPFLINVSTEILTKTTNNFINVFQIMTVVCIIQN